MFTSPRVFGPRPRFSVTHSRQTSEYLTSGINKPGSRRGNGEPLRAAAPLPFPRQRRARVPSPTFLCLFQRLPTPGVASWEAEGGQAAPSAAGLTGSRPASRSRRPPPACPPALWLLSPPSPPLRPLPPDATRP